MLSFALPHSAFLENIGHEIRLSEQEPEGFMRSTSEQEPEGFVRSTSEQEPEEFVRSTSEHSFPL